jgi:membrane associated rhomboid family serine protease
MKVSTALITINTLVFIFFVFLQYYNSDFVLNFILWNPKSDFFNPLQFLSFQFIHVDIFHILFNLALFGYCAYDIEEKIGSLKFLLFYLICGFIAGFSHILFSNFPVAGASGGVWGLIVIYAFLFPDRYLESFYTKIPIITFVLFLFLVEIFDLITGLGKEVSNIAHIGGALTGLLLFKLNSLMVKSKISD